MDTKRKIGIIVGTRPQFIKLFPLIVELNNRKDRLEYFVVHTGQHFDKEMSEDIFSAFNLPNPEYNLGIHSLHTGELIGNTISAVTQILEREKPAMVVVLGDSHSTIAGALAAKYCGIACTHIEAGLRSYDLSMPEEINRIAVDNISDVLCTPTANASNTINHLNQDRMVVQTGDIMLDLFKMIKPQPTIKELGDYLVLTIHRRSLMHDSISLSNIVECINHIDRHLCKVIAPLHPHCINKLSEYGISPTFTIIPPQSYVELRSLITHSKMVITDSGGLQKEAYFARKYCITLRDTTEWIETLHDNCNTLVGHDTELLKTTVKSLLLRKEPCPARVDQFGDGKAASKIVDAIENYWLNSSR